MASLRRRLIYRTTAVAIATVVPASVALYLLVRGALLSQFDGALLLEARSLQSHVLSVRSERGVGIEVIDLPHYDNRTNPWMFQIRQGGTTEAGLPGLATRDFSHRLPSDEPTVQSTTLPFGEPGRMLSLRFVPPPPPPESDDGAEIDDIEPTHRSQLHRKPPSGSRDEPEVEAVEIFVARSTRDLESLGESIRWILGTVNAVAVAIVVLGIHLVARRELRPLSVLANSLGEIRTGGLSEPIVVADAPEEIEPVVARLNELLRRLDRAMARERAFAADVAHELRTPLAGLVTTLEVIASREREPAVYRGAIADCLNVTRGMNSLVGTLLSLARETANRPTREPIDIGIFLRDCWTGFAAIAENKRLRIDWQIAGEDIWLADRESLRLISSNLFDNAVSYVEVGGWVRISTSADGATVGVTVANDGCRLSPSDAEHLFERFWRGDRSRSATGVHCGLGLSLCRKVVEGLDGRIEATIVGEVFEVRATFPADRV